MGFPGRSGGASRSPSWPAGLRSGHAGVQSQPGAPPDQLAQVIVGPVVINADVYMGYSRGANDWADGIRLEHPDRGGMLFGDGTTRANGSRPASVMSRS